MVTYSGYSLAEIPQVATPQTPSQPLSILVIFRFVNYDQNWKKLLLCQHFNENFYSLLY